MLARFFLHGRAADLVLAITLIEAAWFGRRRSAWRDGTMANLAAALCLLGALRMAQGGAGGWVIAACLAGAGIAHLLWLRARHYPKAR